MASVSFVQQPPVLGALVSQAAKPNRATEQVKSLVERVKEFLARVWRAVITGIQTGAGAVSFVFFRALDWIHPTMGPRIEVAFLRVCNIWQGIKDAWNEEDSHKEMNRLRTENQHLHNAAQQSSATHQENIFLRSEVERLKPLEQLALTHEKHATSLLKQQSNLAESEKAVVDQLKHVSEERDHFLTQRDALSKLCEVTLRKYQELQATSAQLAQEVPILKGQIEDKKKLQQRLDKIAQACDTVSTRAAGQKSAIDDEIEQLLPLLLKQIETARTQLTAAKKSLPPHSSAEVAISSLERILLGVVESLERIPQVFKLHANWQTSINEIMAAQVEV